MQPTIIHDLQLVLLRAIADHARQDVHARFEVRNGEKAYRPVRVFLTDDDHERHLRGVQPLGVYLMKGDTTRMGVIDIDDHEGDHSWGEVVTAARSITAELGQQDCKWLAFRSGGGNGIHIFVLFDVGMPAWMLRQELGEVIGAAGFTVGTSGVAAGEVEIFPKQDSVDPEGLGSLIALPLSRQSTGLDEDFNPVLKQEWVPPSIEDIQNRLLEEANHWVPAPEPSGPAMSLLPGDEEEVAAALKHVNAKDYHRWISCGLILKQAFGDDGFALWLEWSRTAEGKFKSEDDCRRKWRSFKPRGKIGIGTLFYWAQQNGWNGPSNPVIRQMNARFTILTHGNRTQIIVHEDDGPESEIEFLSKEVFLDRVKAEFVSAPDALGGTSQAPIGKLWLSHPKAAHCHRLDFDPSKPPGINGRTFNLWRGFAVEPTPGEWSLLRKHILDNICQGDQTKYDWLMNWMALAVQQPALVIGTAPVLKGLYQRAWGLTHGPSVLLAELIPWCLEDLHAASSGEDEDGLLGR